MYEMLLLQLIDEISQIKVDLQQESSAFNKFADNLFAIGNLALAGIVFVQFLPNSKISVFYLLIGIIVFAFMYTAAIVILRRKR
jgi:hypothetical protein